MPSWSIYKEAVLGFVSLESGLPQKENSRLLSLIAKSHPSQFTALPSPKRVEILIALYINLYFLELYVTASLRFMKL